MGSRKKQAPRPELGHPRWPDAVAYNRGFRLLGTPLGFHRNPKAALLFAGHPDGTAPPRHKRLLTSGPVAAALGSTEKNLDTLVLNYGRRIRLGKLGIQLFPSGMGPGTSQLLIELKDRRILYSDGVRLATPFKGLPADIPACDVLLLDFAPAPPRPPSRQGALKAMVPWVQNALDRGKTPVIAVAGYGAATDVLTKLLSSDIVVRAARTLYERHRRLGPHGIALQQLRRLEQNILPETCVVHRADLLNRSRLWNHPAAEMAFMGPGRECPEWAETAWRLGDPEDRSGLLRYITQTGASEVALGPRVDTDTASYLVQKGVNVYRCPIPQQIPLPFPKSA